MVWRLSLRFAEGAFTRSRITFGSAGILSTGDCCAFSRESIRQIAECEARIMSVLSQEVWQVQNPAVGAVLLWRFVVGYQQARDDASSCPLPLVFIVLPTLL